MVAFPHVGWLVPLPRGFLNPTISCLSRGHVTDNHGLRVRMLVQRNTAQMVQNAWPQPEPEEEEDDD